MGYIYVIHVREFINNGETVLKIGRTRDIIKRFAQYPKGSKLICCRIVGDEVRLENMLKEDLSKIFVRRSDIGSEYFEADIKKFVSHVMRVIDSNDTIITVSDACHDDVSNARVTKKDPTLAISEFMDQNLKELSGKHVRSTMLYHQFLEWINKNHITTKVTHTIFTKTLKELYQVETYLHKFEEGQSMAIMFKGTTNEDKTQNYFQTYCVKTNNKQDILKATSLYSHYSTTVKSPIPKAIFLGLACHSLGPYIPRTNKYRNIWRGVLLVEQDAQKDDIVSV